MFTKQIFPLALVLISTICMNQVPAQDFGTSTQQLEKARDNLLKHLDLLKQQLDESEKRYQNYLRAADQEKKRMDSLDYSIRQNEDALRGVEETLRSHP